LYLSKYLSPFVGKYQQTYLQPCRDLCLRLNPALCLDLRLNLYLNLNPSLFRKLFAKSFQSLFRKFFAALFGSMFVSKNPQLWASSCLALCRQMLPGGQSVGRPLPGRIVVRERCITTYRWQPSPWNGAARLPLFREGVRRWQALQPESRGAHRIWAR